MNPATTYLAAEEIISRTPSKTEEGRQQCLAIYNAASHLLDESIGAWYKRVPLEERLSLEASLGTAPSKGEESLHSTSGMFSMLMKVPWIVPVYEYGLVPETKWEQAVRDTRLLSIPTHYIKTPGNDSFSDLRGWRQGIPPANARCVGIVLSNFALLLDESRLDFMNQSSMREAHGNARSSLLEAGAQHTRFLPYAGFIRASGTVLCDVGMNRFFTDWDFNFQGSSLNDSPLQLWQGKMIYDRSTRSAPDILKPVVLARWRSIEEARLWMEALIYQVATLRTWVYTHESIEMKADPSPIEDVILHLPPIERPEFERSLHQRLRKTVKGRDVARIKAVIGFILHSLVKAIGKRVLTTDLRIESGVSATPKIAVDAIHLFIGDSRVRKKTLEDLSTVQSTKSYNPNRIHQLRRMTDMIRMHASLIEREKIFKRLRVELTHTDHFYWDKESGTRVMCDHEMAILEDLVHGISDPDSIAQRFSTGGRMSSIADMAVTMPTVIECKYCGADLGTIWLVSTSGLTDERDVVREMEGSILDDEVLSVIAHLFVGKALQASNSPTDLSRVVVALISYPVSSELSKLAKGRTTDRSTKEKFVILAAVVAALHELQQAGALITLDLPLLQAVLSKEYIDVLQKLGILPEAAVKLMLVYWPRTLSHILRDPMTTLRNAVFELIGTDKTLGPYYRTAIAYPVTGDHKTEFWAIDVEKVRSESSKRYMIEMRRPIHPHTTVPPFNRSRFDPHLHVLKEKSLVLRTTDIGTGIVDEDSFSSTIINVCPALLLHSVPGPKYFPPPIARAPPQTRTKKSAAGALFRSFDEDRLTSIGLKVEEDSPHHHTSVVGGDDELPTTGGGESLWVPSDEVGVTGVLAEEVTLGGHHFISSGDGRKCQWCGIGSDLKYGKEYHEKYQKVVERLERRTAGPSFSCIAPTEKGKKSKGEQVLKLDQTLDKGAMRIFSQKFGWNEITEESGPIVDELARIVGAIGNYTLSAAIRSPTGSAKKSAVITGWNLFIGWMNHQKEPLAQRTMSRLRAIHAQS